MLDMKGIKASSGSACTSGSLDPSHVLLAIGLPHEIAHGSLRITFGEINTEQEVDYLIDSLMKSLQSFVICHLCMKILQRSGINGIQRKK